MKRVLMLSLLSGCAIDFAPPSLLTDTRVLAVEVTPLEVEPGERVTLVPRVYVPEGQAAPTVSWRFCPFTAGARASYACALPACETALTPEADGSVTADPTALALACLSRLGGTAATSSVALPEKVELLFTVTVDGAETIARVPLYPRGAPRPRNRPPSVRAVTALSTDQAPGTSTTTTSTGARTLAALSRGGTMSLAVTAETDSLDAYIDEAGRARTEEPLVSFYATAGRFDSDRSSGIGARSVFTATELLDTDTEASLFLVVRDGRGGQTLIGPLVVPFR